MAFVINTKQQKNFTLPVVEIPKLLWTEVVGKETTVEIINTGNTEEFQQEIKELRLLLLEETWESYDFTFISTTTLDFKYTNPYYFHVPNENPAISIFNNGDKVIVSPIPKEEVILTKMLDRDITTNEVVSDSCKLRGIPAYNKRVKELADKIGADKQWMQDVESMGSEDS